MRIQISKKEAILTCTSRELEMALRHSIRHLRTLPDKTTEELKLKADLNSVIGAINYFPYSRKKSIMEHTTDR